MGGKHTFAETVYVVIMIGRTRSDEFAAQRFNTRTFPGFQKKESTVSNIILHRKGERNISVSDAKVYQQRYMCGGGE
jgi:hypothetical protein